MAEDETTQEPGPIEASDYVAPVLNRRAYHCPRCQVYATQTWTQLLARTPAGVAGSNAYRGECFNCKEHTYWMTFMFGNVNYTAEEPNALMVWPQSSASAPNAHVGMPADVKEDYDEARSIVDRSPRGAALLRLAVQKLMKELGETGDNINDDIKSLVSKGLPVEVQQALDALRVIGNNAVHPGELDLTDDRDTATALFGTLNFIVDQRIAQPKKLQKLYGLIPAKTLAAIQKRDGT